MSTKRRYAEDTKVAVSASMDQISQNLADLGVQDGDVLVQRRPLIDGSVTFRLRSRTYRFVLPVPGPDEDLIRLDARGYQRTAAQIRAVRLQEEKRIWRVLERLTKLFPEMMDIPGFEAENVLLGFCLLQSGETVAEHFNSLVSGGSVPLLSPPKGGEA